MPVSLDGVERWLRDALGSPPDLVVRALRPAVDPGAKVLVAYLSSLADGRLVVEGLVTPLLTCGGPEVARRYRSQGSPRRRLEFLGEALVGTGGVRLADSGAMVLDAVCRGQAAVFMGGVPAALLADTRGPRGRTIDEPTLEATLRGPHDGFTEDLESNLAQLRRRLPHPDLQVVEVRAGDVSRTRVALVYLQNLARPDLVRRVRERLEGIRLDAVLDTGYLEEQLVGSRLRLFPLLLATERPDRVVGNLLEGRLAVLVDGSPSAVVGPLNVGVLFQAADDYYLQPVVASMARLMRFVGIQLSILLPGLYVALVSFHQELIPTAFFGRVAAGREGIPLGSLGEALVMGLAFEVLREAGARLPRQVGQAVSVVGAVVVGEAAIRASLISPLMLIVTSVTAITSFLVPTYTGTVAMWLPRLVVTLLAGMFGLVGVAWGLAVGLYYLASLRPLGVPYLAPAAPFTAPDMRDFLLRVPWRAMARRPSVPGALRRRRRPSVRPESGVRGRAGEGEEA